MISQADRTETVTRVTPLGMRFFDPVTKRIVSDLIVGAKRAGWPGRRLPLLASPSGVFVLNGVPGLRDFEFGRGDNDFWTHLPVPVHYDVLVSDPLRRYLPFRFEAGVPTRRLFQWRCGPWFSPIEAGDLDVPLYSATNRSVPEGMAIVRADLYDPIAQEPAAWSVLEVRYEDQPLGRGIADERGSVVVIVPYPPPVDFVPESPPRTGRSLSQQEWTLELHIGYAPGVDTSPMLDLCSSLSQLEQLPAIAWHDASQTTPLTTATLRYGQELIVGSFDDGELLPRLFVTPAVSPP